MYDSKDGQSFFFQKLMLILFSRILCTIFQWKIQHLFPLSEETQKFKQCIFIYPPQHVSSICFGHYPVQSQKQKMNKCTEWWAFQIQYNGQQKDTACQWNWATINMEAIHNIWSWFPGRLPTDVNFFIVDACTDFPYCRSNINWLPNYRRHIWWLVFWFLKGTPAYLSSTSRPFTHTAPLLKYECSHTSTPHICLQGMHRDNLLFNLTYCMHSTGYHRLFAWAEGKSLLSIRDNTQIEWQCNCLCLHTKKYILK